VRARARPGRCLRTAISQTGSALVCDPALCGSVNTLSGGTGTGRAAASTCAVVPTGLAVVAAAGFRGIPRDSQELRENFYYALKNSSPQFALLFSMRMVRAGCPRANRIRVHPHPFLEMAIHRCGATNGCLRAIRIRRQCALQTASQGPQSDTPCLNNGSGWRRVKNYFSGPEDRVKPHVLYRRSCKPPPPPHPAPTSAQDCAASERAALLGGTLAHSLGAFVDARAGPT
jgi:hypothetical protein